MIDINRITELFTSGKSKYEIQIETNIPIGIIESVLDRTGLMFDSKPKSVDSKTVVLADIHYGHHDEEALSAALNFIYHYRPDRIILLGDIANFDAVSFYLKNSRREAEGKRLLNDINDFKNALRLVENVTSISCEKVFIYGNHCQRINQYLNMQPELDGLINLEPHLNDYKIYQYMEPYELNGCIYVHGKAYNKYVHNTMLDQYGKDITFGHIHYNGIFSKTFYNKSITAMSIGGLCKHDFEYLQHRPVRWTNGIGIVEYYNGVNSRIVIPVTDGTLIYDGKTYK